MSEKFWQTTPLAEMRDEQWEAVCDGCGRCCLVKLEDEGDGSVYYTDIACRLLDLKSCCCLDYVERQSRVPGCIKLSKHALDDLWQMPPSCAYRRLAEGRDLPDWHHLVCGDRSAVHRSGFSVRGLAVGEDALGSDADLEDRLVEWPVLDAPFTRDRRRS